MKNKQHPFRDTFISRHHLLPKSRGLKNTFKEYNILHLWRDKHNIWHCIFHNATITEILSKKYKVNTNTYFWKKMFGDKTLNEAKALLRRMYRIKKS